MIIYVINCLGKEGYNELGYAHHIHLHTPLLHPQVSQLKGLSHESHPQVSQIKGLSHESQACSLG
jgi:hypothetical protein